MRRCSARNPRIVYCSVSGFGESGPLAKEACADFIMQAYSGFARLNGQPGDELEAFRFTGFIDLTTSIVATEGVLAALLARETTGVGQKLEVSMLQAALEMQFTRVAELLGAGASPGPLGSQSPGLAPDRAYAALDGEVFVTAHDDSEWRGFCAAIEHGRILQTTRGSRRTPARVPTAPRSTRSSRRSSLVRPLIWWMRAFERQRVPCALAQHFEQLRYHAQIRDNGMIAEVETRRVGRRDRRRLAVALPHDAGRGPPPPVPGADTARVLAALRPAHAARRSADAQA